MLAMEEEPHEVRHYMHAGWMRGQLRDPLRRGKCRLDDAAPDVEAQRTKRSRASSAWQVTELVSS